MNAFGDAVATSDEDALKALLGADFRTLIPPVGADITYRFLAAWAKSHAIKPEGDAQGADRSGRRRLDPSHPDREDGARLECSTRAPAPTRCGCGASAATSAR